MIALGNTTDTTLNFKLGDTQVHSIWSGNDLVWPTNSGLIFINANWRVIPPFPVYARTRLASTNEIIWTSALFNITQLGCMNFGVSGPYPNTNVQYYVEIRKPDTSMLGIVDPDRRVDMPGSTAGYGECPANEYLETNASNGQVFISGNQAYQGYPQLVFDIFSVV